MTFESALSARVDEMADACTRCGKCVEVCPVTGPGGVKAEPVAVISGIIDILKTGTGPEASRKWANACVLTGECIKACDYGVNPRFMLNMARVRMAQHDLAPGDQRRGGVDGFRKVAREVAHISQMQLSDEVLVRRSAALRRRVRPTSRRTSCSTPVATCSRRRTSRCSRST
jgi:heterodisulfide reductase subunit D